MNPNDTNNSVQPPEPEQPIPAEQPDAPKPDVPVNETNDQEIPSASPFSQPNSATPPSTPPPSQPPAFGTAAPVAPQFAAAQPYQPQTNNSSPGKGLALASMIFGIVGLLTSGLGIGIIPGLVGIILGIIALVKHTSAKGFAIAGMVTGGLAFVFGGILFAITMVAYNGIQQRAQTSANQSYANSLIKKAEAYSVVNPSDNPSFDSAYPTYSELMSATDETYQVDAEVKEKVHEGDASSVTAEKPVAYTGCAAGVVVSYWNTEDLRAEELLAGNPEAC